MIIARCSVRDRCHQNDRQHFVGNLIATVHVRCHGSPNVQGRGWLHYLQMAFIAQRHNLLVLQTILVCSPHTISLVHFYTPLGNFYYHLYIHYFYSFLYLSRCSFLMIIFYLYFYYEVSLNLLFMQLYLILLYPLVLIYFLLKLQVNNQYGQLYILLFYL